MNTEKTMPKGWSRYSPTHRVIKERMRPLGKANPDWSFKMSEHIESLKQGFSESLIPCKKLPTTMLTRTLETAPDWRQQLSEAWTALNNA